MHTLANGAKLQKGGNRKGMETILILGVVVAAVYGLLKMADGDRYQKMTEEEYEAEAKRSSRIGGAMLEVQKIVDPGHHVEYIQQNEKRAEGESAESGDKPESGSATSSAPKASS
jgi:hypothetical protein